jgi:ATP-dependent RNA circularization protein (DNA/RNA ligase family)
LGSQRLGLPTPSFSFSILSINILIFFAYINSHDGLNAFHTKYRDLRLYGEWLVPHTLKTYNDDAWRKFYVFDVFDRKKERLLSYDEYSEGLVAAGINVIAPIASSRTVASTTSLSV